MSVIYFKSGKISESFICTYIRLSLLNTGGINGIKRLCFMKSVYVVLYI